MDKATRALMLAEDNAAKLKMLEVMTAKFSKTVALSGTVANDATEFGTVTVTGAAVVVATFTGAACALMIGDKQIGSGASPLVAAVGAESGMLKLARAVDGATAVVIGGVKQ